MKAISLWQPYASAIALGFKKFETRSWKTSYRGKIAICSASKKTTKEYLELAQKYGINYLPLGKLIAVADLIDCILMNDDFIAKQSQDEINWGDWKVGRYAWKLNNIVLVKPAMVKGQQGLWNLHVPEFEDDLFKEKL